jgi:hypothetical protein
MERSGWIAVRFAAQIIDEPGAGCGAAFGTEANAFPAILLIMHNVIFTAAATQETI